MKRAIVTGMIATYPVGGVVWDYGQYLVGLEDLGFEVYYLEDTGSPTYDPRLGTYGDDCSYGVGFLERELRRLSPALATRWHFRSMDGRCFGIDREMMARVAAGADLFLNVSGGSLLREAYMACPAKVLIDTDPGWNHFVNYPKWDRSPGWLDTAGYRAHDHFFTYAECLGQPDCLLPDMDLPWHPTRPPVVMDRWASARLNGTSSHRGGRSSHFDERSSHVDGRSSHRDLTASRGEQEASAWTTVMTWNNFRRPIEHDGVTYGTKELEFGKVERLPQSVDVPMEVATGGSDAPRERWRDLGWQVVESEAVSQTADDYRSYIRRSRGEFSVAKNVYVATRSGWFSCRSACYLAAARPVVVQDTGFSRCVPTGNGLIAFNTVDEAAAAIDRIESNYAHHSRAALEVARAHLDARVVLGSLLRTIGLAS